MSKQELKQKEIRKVFNELNIIASSPVCFTLSEKEKNELRELSKSNQPKKQEEKSLTK